MPQTTYMVVDPRRDHSMRIPRPDLSVVEGTPNACNMCHADKDAQWALTALRDWGVNFRDTASHPARAFAAAGRGDSRSAPTLAQIAASEDQPAIWRAAATEALAELGTNEAMANAQTMLVSTDPMLRLSGVRAMAALPLPQRYRELQGIIEDPVTAVRLEVAAQLAGVPLDQLPPELARQLLAAFNDYLAVQSQHADMPSVQMQLGLFHVARGDVPRAEYAYREALQINPHLVPALLNLADLMRATGREPEARTLLQQALTVAPDSGDAMHSLGLLESRAGNTEKSLALLGEAAELEQRGVRHRYVYAIALHDNGDINAALQQLRKVLRSAPTNSDVLLALSNYSAEAGQRRQAVGYARKLVELDPRNPGYAQLLKQLQQGSGDVR
jgi:tetratricopeptide (TPR) repeat protein